MWFVYKEYNLIKGVREKRNLLYGHFCKCNRKLRCKHKTVIVVHEEQMFVNILREPNGQISWTIANMKFIFSNIKKKPFVSFIFSWKKFKHCFKEISSFLQFYICEFAYTVFKIK